METKQRDNADTRIHKQTRNILNKIGEDSGVE